MSARFAAIALIASVGWYAWQWHAATLSFGGAALRVLACALVSASVGKIIGILRARASTVLRP
jgi:hypothetical protein